MTLSLSGRRDDRKNVKRVEDFLCVRLQDSQLGVREAAALAEVQLGSAALGLLGARVRGSPVQLHVVAVHLRTGGGGAATGDGA